MTPMLTDLLPDLSALKSAGALALTPGGAGLAEGSETGLSDFAQLLEATRLQPVSARPGLMPDAATESPIEGEPDAARPAESFGVHPQAATLASAMPGWPAMAGGNPLPLAGEVLPDGIAAPAPTAVPTPAAVTAPAAAPAAAPPAAAAAAATSRVLVRQSISDRAQMRTPPDDAPASPAPQALSLAAGSLPAAPQITASAPLDAEAAHSAPLQDTAEHGGQVAVVAALVESLAPVMGTPRPATGRTTASFAPAPSAAMPVPAAIVADGDAMDDEGARQPFSLRLAGRSLATSEPGALATTGAPTSPLSPSPALASPTSAAAPVLALAPSPALVAEAGAALAGDPIRSAASAPDAEAMFDQIATLRDAARLARSDVVLRHGEFGTVNLRIDASGAPGEWRAALTSRDPGFVPAVQAALAERAVAASSEAGANFSQQQNSNANSAGSGAGSGLAQGSGQSPYGSSPGGGQGSSQPYSGQTASEGQGQQTASSGAANATGQTTQSDGDLFA